MIKNILKILRKTMAPKNTLCAALLVLVVSFNSFAFDYVLVVNKDNPISNITSRDAKRIFLGKKVAWPGGETVSVILNEDKGTHDQFLKEILKKSPQQFSIYWKKILFSGRGIPPKSVKTDQDVKLFVATNKNAIGYISKDTFDASKLKKLEVE